MLRQLKPGQGGRIKAWKGTAMHGRVIRIERISPRSGAIVTAKGYQLADPAHGKHNTTPNT